MGQNSKAELAPGGMKISIRILTPKSADFFVESSAFFGVFFYLALLFALICAGAANSFAQDAVLTQRQIDEIAQFDFLSRSIASGTVEQKREALLRIRNYQSAEASALAVPALRDSSEIVRATAAQSVVFLPRDYAAQVLHPLLSDRQPFVRQEAAYALGTVGNPLSVNLLLTFLQRERDSEARDAATVALGKIGDASAINALAQILQRRIIEADEFQRRAAARSIGQIAQIIQTGRVRVITPENFLPENYKVTTRQNYINLSEKSSVFRGAVGVLIRSLQNPNEFQDVKREAAFALGTIGDASAIPVLQANLNDPDYYLAEICKEALAKIQIAVNNENQN